MFLVVPLLYLAPSVGLLNRHSHGVRHLVRIHDNMAFAVAGSTSNGLNQGCLRTQESLLISIQDSHQCNFRNIKSFPQQVDAHQDVEHIHTHIPNNFSPFQRIDIRVKIFYPDTHLSHIVGQILCHPFGQSGDKHLVTSRHFLVYFRNQIVNLTLHRPHRYLRIQKSGGTYDLFHSHKLMLCLISRRSR